MSGHDWKRFTGEKTDVNTPILQTLQRTLGWRPAGVLCLLPGTCMAEAMPFLHPCRASTSNLRHVACWPRFDMLAVEEREETPSREPEGKSPCL